LPRGSRRLASVMRKNLFNLSTYRRLSRDTWTPSARK
jgi:hypothetical protein